MLVDRYDLFIFDWDGTLSTSTSLLKALRLLNRRYSVARITGNKELYKIDTVPQFRRKEEINKIYALTYGFYSVFYKPRLKPGVIELLKHLKQKGKKIAIFSDANRHRLFIEAKRFGVLEHVDFVLSADSIKRYKPNPTGLMMIVDRFKYRKNRCIYVGDMASDVFTARFAGITCCAVGDGVDPYYVLRKVNPDYIVNDLKSLKSIK